MACKTVVEARKRDLAEGGFCRIQVGVFARKGSAMLKGGCMLSLVEMANGHGTDRIILGLMNATAGDTVNTDEHFGAIKLRIFC